MTTRRQELANECVEACLADEVCLSDEECSRVRKHVARALQAVEREVYLRIAKEALEYSVGIDIEVWRRSTKKEMTAVIMKKFSRHLKKQAEVGE